MKTVIVAASLLLLAGSAWACPGSKTTARKDAVQKVDTETLAGWVDEAAVTVVDANSRETFEKGHIPGAVHVDYKTVSASDLPEDKDARVAFYCYSEQCSASKQAAERVRTLGWTNLWVYKAGIEGWKAAGHAVATLDGAKPDKKPATKAASRG